ncbi:unnamed protein product, partial [Brassica rapa]
GVTLPVPDPQDLFIPSEVSDLIMLPPKTKRPPGRSPTKRKRYAGEISPSESEDYGGNDSSDTEDREVEDLIRRDQAELTYNSAATVQYPPQPEVEFGFPQTCYCGGRPKLATSRTVNDPGRRYYTCDNVNDGDCHVHKWWDEAVMEEMRARDTHTPQLSEKVDNLTFLNDYDPQLNKFKELQNETEQKLVRLEKVVSELAEKRTRGRNYYVCKDFKNDGLHIRHDCLTALEEELDCLRSQYAEEVSLRRELQFELAQMREEIKELKQLIMLIELAKAGLKEEIREGLETDEFATLEALFEEAEEVEEGLKETPPSTPRKRRRTSPNPAVANVLARRRKKVTRRMTVTDMTAKERRGLRTMKKVNTGTGCRWRRTWMTTRPTGPTTHWVMGSSGWTTTQPAPAPTSAPPTPTRNLLLF